MSATKQKEYLRAWHARNRDRVAAKAKIRYIQNRDQRIAATKAWKEANPDRVKASIERHRKEQNARSVARYHLKKQDASWLERRNAQRRKLRSDPEYRQNERLRQAKTQQLNPEAKPKRKAWEARNRYHLKEYKRTWRKNNWALVRQYNATRRAQKKQAAVNLAGINEFVRSVKSKPYAFCYYCSKKFPSRTTHFEHIIPLVKGGQHSVDNLCVSCPACNLSKADKTPQAWIKLGQQFLAL